MAAVRDARIVVIGGGALGCAAAYHLARMGAGDVLLLEKAGLTHGATWHAAGLVGQLRSKRNLTRLMRDSVDLYGRIGAETGMATDWKPVGSLRLAASADRWLELRRAHGQARAFGLEMELLSPAEARDLFPHLSTDGVVGAAFIPGDGHVDPSGLTQAYARGARDGGVTIAEGVLVTGLEVRGRRVVRVLTDQGPVRCETVLVAAGLWARQVAAMAGIALPAGVVEHQYMVTEKGLDLAPDTPTLRDPDGNFYLKPEVGGFAVGGWEADTRPLTAGLPFDFGRELLASNFDRFEGIALSAARRIPVLNDLGVRNLINGPIPISPDGEPIMGPAPDLDNLFLACGFTSGIAASGGAGQAMARWILEGDPGMDLWAFDLRRFGPHHANPRFLAERAVEAYGRYYQMHWPSHEMDSARGARRSPLHGRLAARGAVFGSKFGWERPNWFAAPGTDGREVPTFGRPGWFDAVAAEHAAVRSGVAMIDQSSFSKFQVSGPGAAAFLQRLAANDLDRPPGAAVYTQLLNDRGGIEADLTVMRLTEDSFYVVTGSGFGVRDGQWIRGHMPDDGSVRFADLTSARAVINLCGPKSRQVLERVADGDVSNAAFPYMTCAEIGVGYAPALAIRLTYMGELGWELHIPTEFAAHAHDALRAAGADLGLADVGYRAIDGLRLEKRYLYWGADIGPDHSPLEAGLGFCVAWDKGDFRGRDALLRQRDAGVDRRLVCLLLDRDAPVHGGEPILRGGRVLGLTTSGGFGHTVGRPVVLGYVPADQAGQADYAVEVFGESVPATRSPRAPYDPERRAILA
ncbi:MAG: FAD-dependent oxidoreductase [Hyphomicrobiales bacterium]|nr:FAD-dependent oxidoreductase [Hyphomicrobiales bacterium]MCP5370103.1 FAD-dependent oxidoreductase [Hyphomicrobiales bacterium]